VQPKVTKKVAPERAAPSVENFMKLIFDQDMFKGAMASFDIDVKKMPLGQISKSQVKKGYDVLEELEQAINANSANADQHDLVEVLHAHPAQPSGEDSAAHQHAELLHKKVEMLNVLNDIEIASEMEKAAAAGPEPEAEPHPADENYKKLKADLEYIDPTSDEYAWIQKYLQNTGASYYNLKLVDVFRLNRHGEGDALRGARRHRRAQAPLARHQRRGGGGDLLHGAAHHAALRRPRRQGHLPRLGERQVVNYVGWAGSTGVHVPRRGGARARSTPSLKDDSSLKEAPKGYDSIVARGHTEPDPQHDIITIDGKTVVVPRASPSRCPQYAKSSFTQSRVPALQGEPGAPPLRAPRPPLSPLASPAAGG
jgi:poly [ADP-ribose] polymerase